MTHVYVVAFYSTKQRYETIVCGSMEAVNRLINARKTTELVYETSDGLYWEYVDPNDTTQVASISYKKINF